ncbi:MarR family winged helix-turn-helix transcriptional regulator [Paenibacillus harenae]|uniref:MarR family winged helix-turn-helix transcriptional regulator n=1 Tax=Paenibacillus harenae TaxID=306543 RepID=UPI00278E118A|nr:MarR family transcriptional regulator [Paenibacillus harenae]MDQ0061880.1 DNA-binding MarR family transcriptional regulator [Paenibacillus harenae]
MDHNLLQNIIHRYEAANFLVNRRLNAMIRELMPEELTIDQFATLRYLHSQGRSTSSELADIFCVGKSSITAIINRLFDKKLIYRLPDEKDRRVTYLALTGEGKQLYDEMDAKVYELLVKYISPFDEQEAMTFIETFEKLARELGKPE